jgi:hypothetical protein
MLTLESWPMFSLSYERIRLKRTPSPCDNEAPRDCDLTLTSRCNGRIPTGLITVGSNVSSLTRLLSRLNEQFLTSGEGGVVVLESGDASNLKTSLKNIIRAAITNTEGNDGYQKFLTDRAVRLG